MLQNAFNSSDIDRDGVLSKNDLKLTSGLQAEEEVEALFRALKGDGDETEVVTFEEFCKSALDFPFLLEQFADEYEDLLDQEKEEILQKTISLKSPIALFKDKVVFCITPSDVLKVC